MPRMDDWYPYHGNPETLRGLEQAGINPAQCWIGDVCLSDGRNLNPCPVVAIWGRDLKAFRKAVPEAHREAVVCEYGHAPKCDLATLRAAVK